jgi:DNA-binding NarL/FixJ family response regulator
MHRVRVAAVAGHAVILGVVRLACDATPSLVFSGEAASLSDAESLIGSDPPDVVVLDLDLEGSDRFLAGLRALGFVGGVLVLSDRADGASVLAAMRAGASGYLVKASGLRDVGSAVLRVANGEHVVEPRLERSAAVELGRIARQAREGTDVLTSLSQREREVLVLLAEGATMRQMGRRLGISPRTVETHVGNLYRKIGVRTRVQAVARAASLRLIELR